ncbi:MAG: hypothetical protein BMS9Abin07_0058 [Acidimicrobiia bacterium]|nr:MAG: hypothetical protein BMS9Abin07_0058 [Acidimicrobiia bacterium]
MSVAPPYVVCALFAVSSLLTASLLVFDPEPFSPGSALLITLGLLAYTVIALVGILLVHAPWARWLALTTTLGALVIAAIVGFDSPVAIVSTVVALIAIAGISGPWLTLSLRRRQGSGPEPRAVALPLLAIGAAPIVGFASWSGLATAAVVVSVLGPLGGWAYARALRWGLWVLRLGYPVAAVVAATQLHPAGATLLIVHAAAVAVIAWSPQASRAQRPISAELPAPRPRRRGQ